MPDPIRARDARARVREVEIWFEHDLPAPVPVSTSRAVPATPDQEWAMACCDWPALRTVEKAKTWKQVEYLLLTTPLPTAVYDLAVDRLHDRTNPLPPEPKVRRQPKTRRSPSFAWRQAGFSARRDVLAELRRLGYAGPTNQTVADLWVVLCGLRDDLAG